MVADNPPVDADKAAAKQSPGAGKAAEPPPAAAHDPAPLPAAQQPAAGSTTAEAPPSNSVKLTNGAVVPLTAILPDSIEKATAADGVSFYSTRFQGTSSGATAHVRVTAYASASAANDAVIAVFVSGRRSPVGIASKPVAGDQRTVIELAADIPGVGSHAISLDFRIGPARPGTIVFNGPQGSAAPVATGITIRE